MGYTERAQSLGGFPNGYLQVAAELNILEHASIAADSYGAISRGAFSVLLLNALRTPFYGEEDSFLWDRSFQNNDSV